MFATSNIELLVKNVGKSIDHFDDKYFSTKIALLQVWEYKKNDKDTTNYKVDSSKKFDTDKT